MKELEKTKRISIAAVLTILVVLIALLSYKRPKHIYTLNTQSTLEKIISQDYFITFEEINNPDYVLIDIRNQYEYEKGHLENAINVYAPEILNDDNSDLFEELKQQDKTFILYGTNPNEVITPFMLLYQLGYDSIKILSIESSYDQNKLIVKNVSIENSAPNINGFIAASIKKSVIKQKPKVVKRPKKIITIKKKKKKAPEGGC